MIKHFKRLLHIWLRKKLLQILEPVVFECEEIIEIKEDTPAKNRGFSMQIHIWIYSPSGRLRNMCGHFCLFLRPVQPTFTQTDAFTIIIPNNAEIARYGCHNGLFNPVVTFHKIAYIPQFQFHDINSFDTII